MSNYIMLSGNNFGRAWHLYFSKLINAFPNLKKKKKIRLNCAKFCSKLHLYCKKKCDSDQPYYLNPGILKSLHISSDLSKKQDSENFLIHSLDYFLLRFDCVIQCPSLAIH